MLAVTAFASPSGLNNIPTADTAGDRVLVVQDYTTFGPDRRPDHSAGFKYGIAGPGPHRFEVGMDGRFSPDRTERGEPGFTVKLNWIFDAKSR